jgi:hypothetical protein
MFQVHTWSLIEHNIVSPMVLAFCLGLIAKVVKSDLQIPKDMYHGLSIYLLLAIGLKGGVELSHTAFSDLIRPLLATLFLGVVTPVSTFAIAKGLGFKAVDASALAAHYGSVSAVTYITATQFCQQMGLPPEGFMPTLLTALESPGIAIGLFIGIFLRSRSESADNSVNGLAVVKEVLISRSMLLLLGGLMIGLLIQQRGYAPVQPFFENGFKGALVLFLLELGCIAGQGLAQLRVMGMRLIVLGLVVPVLHGTVGAMFGIMAGLSCSGATVLGSMAASASYIAAPPAVRLTLPQANLPLALTCALGITFPFNLILGIPLYYRIADWFLAWWS